jgi:hexulose-6-phosphate isomerase
MKKGISAWAFPSQNYPKNFAWAREAGFDGLELTMNEEPMDTATLRQQAKDEGIELYSLATGLYWTYPLTANDPNTRAKAEDIAKRQFDTAADLGCTDILVVPGAVSVDVPYDTAYDRAIEAVNRLAKHAESAKVTIGLEYVWNNFLLSPLEYRDFIDKINSDYVKAYFDAGNVAHNGFPTHWVNILGHRICQVHIKDFRRDIGNITGFCPLLEGDINLPAVVEALRGIGYDGWITAEMGTTRHYPEVGIKGISLAMDYLIYGGLPC